MQVKDLFIEYHIPNYSEVKDQIMSSIESNACMSYKSVEGSSISDTNYFDLGNEFPYTQLVADTIDGFFQKVSEEYGFSVHWNGQCWHQVYERGDYHGWHTHPGVNYSAVFSVQCGENQGTVFKIGKEEYQFPSIEGTIVAFPSGLLHRTLPHNSEEKRVVLAFNWEKTGPYYEREV